MLRYCRTLAVLGTIAVAGVACQDRPHGYDEQRPPIDELDKRDKGLQSTDVMRASDQMAMDLLALPELNAADHRWTIVVDHVENRTSSDHFDLDIFLERLRVNLAKHGKGRAQLIENRAKLRDLQARELEQEREDVGQGAAPGPAGTQPDYSLYGRIMELPNRGTSYFLCEFTLTDLRKNAREQIWTNAYEVRVAR